MGQKSQFSTTIWLWIRWLLECCQQFRPWLLYSTKRWRPLSRRPSRRNATHQWILFVTASLDGCTEENRTEFSCTHW